MFLFNTTVQLYVLVTEPNAFPAAVPIEKKVNLYLCFVPLHKPCQNFILFKQTHKTNKICNPSYLKFNPLQTLAVKKLAFFCRG